MFSQIFNNNFRLNWSRILHRENLHGYHNYHPYYAKIIRARYSRKRMNEGQRMKRQV